MLKKFNAKIMILALSAVVVLGILFIASSSKSTPEKTLVKYNKAYEEGDYEKMKKLISPEGRSLFEGYQFLTGFDFDEENLEGKTKTVVDEVVYGEDKKTARVSYYTVTEGKDDIEIDHDTVSMVKVGRKWYIDVNN